MVLLHASYVMYCFHLMHMEPACRKMLIAWFFNLFAFMPVIISGFFIRTGVWIILRGGMITGLLFNSYRCHSSNFSRLRLFKCNASPFSAQTHFRLNASPLMAQGFLNRTHSQAPLFARRGNRGSSLPPTPPTHRAAVPQEGLPTQRPSQQLRGGAAGQFVSTQTKHEQVKKKRKTQNL